MTAVTLDAPPAFRFHAGARCELLVLCDHASNAIPFELSELGLSAADRERHIAWDIGAQGVAAALADRLRCPAFFGVWSRLVIDLNRSECADDLIAQVSDGTSVPGNIGLSAHQRGQRVDQFHRPYHRAIEQHVRDIERNGVRVVLISIHTFTPAMSGQAPRPWHAGVVWKHRPIWLSALLEYLAKDGAIIGDNCPYNGLTEMGYTLEHLGIAASRSHVMFEIRQDLLQSIDQQEAWAQRIFEALNHCGIFADE